MQGWIDHKSKRGTGRIFLFRNQKVANGFAFDNRPYPATSLYRGAYQFKKHFFGSIGDLEAKGEEFECAKVIDTLSQVKYWIGNLPNRPQTSFWLPTSTDRFYPDFVAILQDGPSSSSNIKAHIWLMAMILRRRLMLASFGQTKAQAKASSLWHN